MVKRFISRWLHLSEEEATKGYMADDEVESKKHYRRADELLAQVEDAIFSKAFLSSSERAHYCQRLADERVKELTDEEILYICPDDFTNTVSAEHLQWVTSLLIKQYSLLPDVQLYQQFIDGPHRGKYQGK